MSANQTNNKQSQVYVIYFFVCMYLSGFDDGVPAVSDAHLFVLVGGDVGDNDDNVDVSGLLPIA